MDIHSRLFTLLEMQITAHYHGLAFVAGNGLLVILRVELHPNRTMTTANDGMDIYPTAGIFRLTGEHFDPAIYHMLPVFFVSSKSLRNVAEVFLGTKWKHESFVLFAWSRHGRCPFEARIKCFYCGVS